MFCNELLCIISFNVYTVSMTIFGATLQALLQVSL
jgi:hypothetical protein